MIQKRTLVVVAASIPALVLLLPLLMGVWLPDVLFGGTRTLASVSLTNGYTFRVVQYWNHVDFYSTELRVTSPGGRTEIHTLDGDDAKTWRVPLTIDQARRVASITLGGGRLRTVNW